ncbi:MAG TPA: hypothetical protein VHR38_01170 [Solirubrobacterales bacterium]|jgi:hypothetical protein|nr:hypothetical protein [Solirubrobacterales bacterium]
METASRTLVMSPPELWEVIDQPERMQGLMCALIGRATEVTVNEREPESVLRWQASENGADAWIEVQLSEKGWGTNVKLKAENGGEPTKLEGWLDAVLDELATPQKRPFESMDAPPPEPAEEPAPAPVPAPVVSQPPLIEAPEPEPVPPAAETAEPESPEPGTPEPETSEPEPAKQGKLRRFLGL